MACRVGMSTDPEERIQYWKKKEGHTNGKILHSELTYDKAQELERSEAQAKGCRQGLGGERVPGRVWSVYHVWGGR